jgi:hypothetical protein
MHDDLQYIVFPEPLSSDHCVSNVLMELIVGTDYRAQAKGSRNDEKRFYKHPRPH